MACSRPPAADDWRLASGQCLLEEQLGLGDLDLDRVLAGEAGVAVSVAGSVGWPTARIIASKLRNASESAPMWSRISSTLSRDAIRSPS